MFFLLRCLFWLGLAFSHIAALEGTNATALAGQGAHDIGQAATGLGRMAIDAASKKCRGEPEKCLTIATQAAALGNAAALENAPALGRAAVFGNSPTATRKVAANADREASSRDTLNTGDRIPAWRLRTE